VPGNGGSAPILLGVPSAATGTATRKSASGVVLAESTGEDSLAAKEWDVGSEGA
jgi:hypothetical protein